MDPTPFLSPYTSSYRLNSAILLEKDPVLVSTSKPRTMAPPAARAATATFKTFRELHGVVVSAGLMDKTVKVRVGGLKWNNFLKKVGHPSLSPQLTVS